MPKSLQEIIDHAGELAARFEAYEPHEDDHRDPQALVALRQAVVARAETEQVLIETVLAARDQGHSWAAIGALLGISGEAARQRYSQLTTH